MYLSTRSSNFSNMDGFVLEIPKRYRSDLAYGLSKNFVVWYKVVQAQHFGDKGVRILSVSSGSSETQMGEIEKEETLTYQKYCALKWYGKPEEIAKLLVFLSKLNVRYRTGVDILMDDGCVSGKKNRA